MNASVSVVVTTYNQSAFIEATLESALRQTYRPLDVVVVDDGSTDDTPARVERFKKHVTYIRQANKGVAAARNTGVAAARGNFIALLDGDDIWHPEKVARQVAALTAHPEAGLCATDGAHFSEADPPHGHLLGTTIQDMLAAATGDVVCDWVHAQLLARNFIATTSQVMIPAAVFRRVGPSDQGFRLGSDYDLYLRIAARYRFVLVKQSLVHWRYHPTSASGPVALRNLRWLEDDILILKKHLAELPPHRSRAVARTLRQRVLIAAINAYHYGRTTDRSAAARYLRNVMRHAPLTLTPLAFLAGLYCPRPLAARFGALLRGMRLHGTV